MRPRMFRASLLVGTLVVLTTSFGCYTVVRHPQSMQVAGRVDDGFGEGVHDGLGTSGSSACSDCHFESEWLGYFDHPLIYGFGGYATHERWYDYYDRPWWYDSYWDDGAGSPGSPFPSGGVSSWTRRPRVRGEDSIVNDNVPSSTTSGATAPSGSTPVYSTPNTQPAGGTGSNNTREAEPSSSYDKKKRTPR